MRPAYNTLYSLVRELTLRYQRPPTVQESYDFIFGDPDLRHATWNKGPNEESSTYQINPEELDLALDGLMSYLNTGANDGSNPSGD